MLAAAGDPVKGKELFQSCSGCHNVANDQRKTGPSLRSLFGRVTLHNGNHADDENVRAIILDGYNGMPSFRYSFRPGEIDDLLAYLHTLTGRPAETKMSAGEQYFRAYCARCHETNLRGTFTDESVGPVEEGHHGAPPLKEWLDDASRKALYEYLKGIPSDVAK